MRGTAKEVAIAKLSSHTGAEVLGVDLTRPLELALRERLYQAFVEYSVLVVRDQKLDAPQFLAAMQNFGEIFPQHNSRFAEPECPLVHYISNQDKLEDGRVYIPGEGYHTDHSNDEIPPKATALHTVRLSATGGDTQFVNMHEAYDALPEATRRRIDGRLARHVYQSATAPEGCRSSPARSSRPSVTRLPPGAGPLGSAAPSNPNLLRLHESASGTQRHSPGDRGPVRCWGEEREWARVDASCTFSHDQDPDETSERAL
jgi:alpha-ketoglutarate-dependent taurine dioxygenase